MSSLDMEWKMEPSEGLTGKGQGQVPGVVVILSSEPKFSISPPEQGISFPNQM